MKKLHVGFASFAHMHAYSYFSCMQEMEDVVVKAVAEENTSSIPKVKGLGLKTYSTYEELAKDDEIDVVIVTTETLHHKRAAILSLEAGKDVIVEKPIAITLEDADAMIRAADKNGRMLIQCYPCRYHPTASYLKDFITDGSMGKLLAISGTNRGQMPQHAGVEKWFSKKDLAGGGALMDHITHLADLYFWYSDQAIKSVYAMQANLFHPDVDIEDAGMVSLTYDQGMTGSIDPSWSRPKNYETWGDLKMVLYGTEATISLDMFRQFIRIQSNNETHPMVPNYGSNMDALMLEDFFDHIRKDEPPMLTGQDGRKALEVALMAYESAEEGRRIEK